MSEQRTLPSEIGGYSVVGQLGHGSYGSVFRVRRKGLLRDFALKVLPADLRTSDLQRFRREARLVARLDHPHVVRGIEFGRDAETGWHFLCLDLVEGPSLKKHLQAAGTLPWTRAVEITGQVARALDYAHAQGVIHRDLKPANVLLDRHGFARVTDFGLARDLGELTLTAPGEVLGTPYYMSREQVRGDKATPAFDVHALGVILFELVTGERPFGGESVAEVVTKILEHDPPAPSAHTEQRLPPGFDAICQRAMSPDPQARFPSARALADALEDLEHAQRHGVPLPARKTPASVGLPAAQPRGMGPVLGAVVTSGILLPLLSLALVWGWSRGRARPAPSSTDTAAVAETPPDVPALLAETVRAIETWDLRTAEENLALLRREAPERGPELADLGKLQAAATLSEHDELRRIRELYTRQLRGYVALHEALDLRRARPGSDGLTFEAAYLLAVCGDVERAADLHREFRGPHGDTARVQALVKLLERNAGREPTQPAVWQRWRPYQGGLWRTLDGGGVHGEGFGLGDYGLAGLLESRERVVPPPYRLEVQVTLGEAEKAYGGLLFGLGGVGEGYLAYLVREPNAIDKYCTPEQRAELQSSGRAPLFFRVAQLQGGDWTMISTRLCAVGDPGASRITVQLEVQPTWVRATVDGQRERQVNLPFSVQAGEVGVLNFYGDPVSYRGFDLRKR